MTDLFIRKRLEESNYRLTQQRKAVLDVMKENRGKHLSAEEVLAEARKKAPNLGIATVYRALDKLSSFDVLYKTAFDEGKYRYELSEDENHHHHHVICLSCSQIIEIEEDLLYQLEKHLEAKGFEVLDHQLIIYGRCPQCINLKKE
ncbi:MAG: Fur family transcriptional regulator [Syntrophomonas sp.]